MRFDFSAFNDKLETLEERFEGYCDIKLRGALERNADLFPDEVRRHVLSRPAIDVKLGALFDYAGEYGIPLYILIDEYDNFANTVLVHRGREACESFTHGGGFYRNFFATLKAGAGEAGGGLERLFITGVSPITMDDVTSGFNIGRNVTLEPEFNGMLGFTEPEVRGLLELYRERGAFNQDVDAAPDHPAGGGGGGVGGGLGQGPGRSGSDRPAHHGGELPDAAVPLPWVRRGVNATSPVPDRTLRLDDPGRPLHPPPTGRVDHLLRLGDGSHRAPSKTSWEQRIAGGHGRPHARFDVSRTSGPLRAGRPRPPGKRRSQSARSQGRLAQQMTRQQR